MKKPKKTSNEEVKFENVFGDEYSFDESVLNRFEDEYCESDFERVQEEITGLAEDIIDLDD